MTIKRDKTGALKAQNTDLANVQAIVARGLKLSSKMTEAVPDQPLRHLGVVARRGRLGRLGRRITLWCSRVLDQIALPIASVVAGTNSLGLVLNGSHVGAPL